MFVNLSYCLSLNVNVWDVYLQKQMENQHSWLKLILSNKIFYFNYRHFLNNFTAVLLFEYWYILFQLSPYRILMSVYNSPQHIKLEKQNTQKKAIM